MAIATFYTSNSDGVLVNTGNATYATAHDAATSDGILANNISTFTIGQLFHTDSKFYLYRSFIYFDTSTIPDDATIISATLTLFTNSKLNVDTDFNIVIRSGMPDYPEDPFVTGDYLYSHYSDDGGSINTANVSATINAANVINLNNTGLGWINKTGTTKFALISSRDIDSLIPDGKENIDIQARTATSGTSVVAKLIITYDAETYPSVTTQAATNIQDVSVKGNGTLTDGGVATKYGFEYGLTETPTREVSLTKNIGEGAFSLNINGLEPSTTYYYRAKVTNSHGTAVGNWVSFTTKASPSYGIHTESNNANYRLYVSDDEAIAWQGYRGPYSGKQTNINITDLTNKTKGVKVLKIDPDAKGTFHVTIVVKQEIKS